MNKFEKIITVALVLITIGWGFCIYKVVKGVSDAGGISGVIAAAVKDVKKQIETTP